MKTTMRMNNSSCHSSILVYSIVALEPNIQHKAAAHDHASRIAERGIDHL